MRRANTTISGRQTDGKWHRQELPFDFSSDQWTIRPQLVVNKDDQLFLIYNHDENIAVAAATRAGGFIDWRLIIKRSGNFTGEAKMDILRLQNENTLSIYMHERPSKAHEGTPLHIIDFKIKVKQERQPRICNIRMDSSNKALHNNAVNHALKR